MQGNLTDFNAMAVIPLTLQETGSFNGGAIHDRSMIHSIGELFKAILVTVFLMELTDFAVNWVFNRYSNSHLENFNFPGDELHVFEESAEVKHQIYKVGQQSEVLVQICVGKESNVMMGPMVDSSSPYEGANGYVPPFQEGDVQVCSSVKSEARKKPIHPYNCEIIKPNQPNRWLRWLRWVAT